MDLQQVRAIVGAPLDEWSIQSGLRPEQLAAFERGQLKLTREEKCAAEQALKYLLRKRMEQLDRIRRRWGLMSVYS